MIDIHTHILPETDDGADSLTEAVEMLKICTQSGVTDVVLTPHGNLTEVFPESRQESINNQFKRLEKRLSELNMQINIYKGMEVFASYNLYDKLSDGTIWTLNQSKYLLTEFSFDTDREILFELLQIIESKGLIPVIAHPEQFDSFDLAEDFARRGLIQGVEVWHPRNSVEARARLREMAGQYRLLETGGSDFHGQYAKRPNPLGACGCTLEQIERLLYWHG